MGISTTPSMIANLVRATHDHFSAAQNALPKLDWITYGNEMKAVQLGLEKLREATKQWEEEPKPPIGIRKP